MLVGHIFCGHPHGEVCPTMVAMFNNYDCLTACKSASDLDSVFNGFGTRIKKCTSLVVITGREFIECLTHFYVAGVGGNHETGVREVCNLFYNTTGNFGVRVTNRCDCNSRSHVNE